MKPSIEDIFADYKNKIFGLAVSITRNSNDAEDIVQNTFLKIMNNIQRFNHRAKLSTWIYKIAYNEALMLLRKRRGRLGLEERRLGKEPGPFIKGANPTRKEILDDEFRDRMDMAIRRMPIKYRMAFLLYSVEGFSIREAAVILGLNTNSMKTRLYRAYGILRSQVMDYFKDKQETGALKEDPSCGTMIGFVYEYAGGGLARVKREAFDNHIKDCPSCMSFLGAYAGAINITRALQCQDLPPEMEARLKTFILEAAPGK
ncbi:MAG: sigma-70 family RNA polymerase sigma factor [Candidatus Omnitrophica bacterium]|nr:sigma-70 family RNA polymerase sigma factor [Candidatus Omnitrophota bacterium]